MKTPSLLVETMSSRSRRLPGNFRKNNQYQGPQINPMRCRLRLSHEVNADKRGFSPILSRIQNWNLLKPHLA